MKELLSAASIIKKLCLPQKFDPNKAYHPTVYHLAVPCDGGVRIYNTMTGEMIFLSDGESWEQHREEFIARRFLVPESNDERQYVNSIRDIIRLTRRKKTKTHFTIFSTTDCNARCFYCYEHGRRRIAMSTETAHDAADYIARVSGGEKVKLRWFGGEPLYNPEAIRTICTDLSERGIEFTSSMVSNGLYLTEGMVREAWQAWKLKSVQITLDGTEAVYNRTKAYIDRDINPYRTVLGNIKACLSAGIRVAVRLNVNEANAEDVMCLCASLADEFREEKLLYVYAAPIRNADGITTEADKEAVLHIEKMLLNTGLMRQGRLKNDFKVNRCMADDDSSETILPDGSVGKCEHFSDNEFIGSIREEAQDAAVIASWKEQMVDQKECAECPLYPRCIRLKKCEWEQAGCSEADRLMKIQRLKYQIEHYQPEPEKDTQKT